MRYITVDKIKYRIRGQYTASELRKLFPLILEKFPGTTMTFKGWLIGYGKVYNRVR